MFSTLREFPAKQSEHNALLLKRKKAINEIAGEPVADRSHLSAAADKIFCNQSSS